MNTADPTISAHRQELVTREPHAGTGRLTPIGTVNFALRHVRLLLVFPLCTAALAALMTLFQDPEYTATASVVEHRQRVSDQFGGLASRLGIPGVVAGGSDLAFFIELLESRSLLREVAAADYVIPAGADRPAARGTLAELLELEAESAEDRLDRAAGWLRRHLEVESNSEAGLLTVRITAPHPRLAEQLSRRALESLQRFGVERLQSQAATNRSFIQARLREAEVDLLEAEEAVREFREANRRFNSPELQFEETRLQRRVQIQQGIYMTLAEALEEARIEEARDVPSLSVLDDPEGSAYRSDRGALLNAALGAILGLVLAGIVLAGRYYLQRARLESPHEYSEMMILRRRMAHRALGLLKR